MLKWQKNCLILRQPQKPETTTTSPYNSLKAKVFVAMKYKTSPHSQRSMNALSNLPAVISLGFKILGNITLAPKVGICHKVWIEKKKDCVGLYMLQGAYWLGVRQT